MRGNRDSFVTKCVLALASLLWPSTAVAMPSLTISSLGANLSGNLEWLVAVAPDPALFTTTDLGLGGSLAVELGLEVRGGSLLGATVNAVDWPLDISGNNPFTSTVTTGLQIDFVGNTVFASLLSEFLVASNDVELLTLETAGSDCTTVGWGGHTLLSGMADEYSGSLIAQAGQSFTGYQGTLTEPAVDGDFDTDCDVDGNDFIEWQKHFGTPFSGAELADWEMGYGTAAPLRAMTAVVPEPSSAVLLAVVLVCRCSLRLYGLRQQIWDS